MRKLIHFVQNLSLDITAGSLVMCLFIGKLFAVAVSNSMLLGLALAIWLIYSGDHLLDAKKAKEQVSNPRHAFHKKFFQIISGIALIAFSVGLWNLKFLPERTMIFGAVLAGLSLLYLVYSYTAKRAFNKELFAALVYAFGVSVAPLSLLKYFHTEYLWTVLIVVLLAYSNLLIISDYESHVDREDNQQSVALRLDNRWFKKVITISLILCFMLTQAYWFETANTLAYFIFMLMLLVLSALYIKPKWFSKGLLYRILGDGIFFLPIFYLL